MSVVQDREVGERRRIADQDRPLGPFEIVLIDDDSTPEVVATVADYWEAEAFARAWLMEPLGLGVGIRQVVPSASDTI